MEAFEGSWVNPEIVNFEEYMKACGVSYVVRKLAANMKDKAIFVLYDAKRGKFTSESTFKNQSNEFILDEECVIETADGRKFYATFTFENGVLVERQRPFKDGGIPSTVWREVKGNKLIITLEAAGVKAIRTYTKQQ
uniref:Lipocln_cytosolic_FA-bd_dom domain-containing protein n=1 Tax=Rhabditophanes sp. KR3021 TaxID=114890 RepID=A0AC35TLB1_9BILA